MGERRRGVRLAVITGLIDRDINYVVGPLIELLPLAGGGVAAVFNNTIYLFSPTTHAAALPVAFANYCPGGVIKDEFCDVNSGWPSGVSDDIVFGYFDNQYAIALRQADQWFAVSRGDKWINGQAVEIATHVLLGEGQSGLVFGLNDDWSHFYTFEVIPHLGRWAVFEFRDDVGWTLLQTGLPGNIAHDDWNRLKIQREPWDDDELILYVNGSNVGTTAERQGRIAISGGSFAPNFEARYDDYLFAGQNCRGEERAGDVDFAPPISRPPIETFLQEGGNSD